MTTWSACHRFWIAFLHQTIEDAEPITPTGTCPALNAWRQRDAMQRAWRRVQAEARAYLRSDVYALGSFDWVCDVLGLDRVAVQRQLEQRWARAGAPMRRTARVGLTRGAPTRLTPRLA